MLQVESRENHRRHRLCDGEPLPGLPVERIRHEVVTDDRNERCVGERGAVVREHGRADEDGVQGEGPVRRLGPVPQEIEQRCRDEREQERIGPQHLRQHDRVGAHGEEPGSYETCHHPRPAFTSDLPAHQPDQPDGGGSRNEGHTPEPHEVPGDAANGTQEQVEGRGVGVQRDLVPEIGERAHRERRVVDTLVRIEPVLAQALQTQYETEPDDGEGRGQAVPLDVVASLRFAA